MDRPGLDAAPKSPRPGCNLIGKKIEYGVNLTYLNRVNFIMKEKSLKTIIVGDRTVCPTKIVCVGRNYLDHIEELNN